MRFPSQQKPSAPLVKRAVRERDGYKCVECGMTAAEHKEKFGRTLDVHRLDPGKLYVADRCITLCRPCHATKPKKIYGERADGGLSMVLHMSKEMVDQIDFIAEFLHRDWGVPGKSRMTVIRWALYKTRAYILEKRLERP